MKDTRVKEENFICIQGWMISKLNLKGNDLLVYAIIYGYSQDGRSCFSGGLQYLADWVNGTKRGVHKNLDNLESKGLIQKESYMADGISTVKYKCNPIVLSKCGQDDYEKESKENNNFGKESNKEKPGKEKNNKNEEKGVEQSSIECGTEFHGGIEQSSIGCGTEFHGGIEQSSTNNINIINQKNNIKDTSLGEQPKRSELIKSIVDQWNGLQDYGIRPIRRLSQDSIRYGQLNARINDYGYENVIQAIENIKQSSFLHGDNDRGWMIDFDWFVKPNNFCKVWEGKYIDQQKGVKDNDSNNRNRGYSGKYNSGNTEPAKRKYDPTDFLGDQWKKD